MAGFFMILARGARLLAPCLEAAIWAVTGVGRWPEPDDEHDHDHDHAGRAGAAGARTPS